jgi:hypothetical protein
VCRPTNSRDKSVIPTAAKRSGKPALSLPKGTLCFQRPSALVNPFQSAAYFRDTMLEAAQ